jgi:hypothetical protein
MGVGGNIITFQKDIVIQLMKKQCQIMIKTNLFLNLALL